VTNEDVRIESGGSGRKVSAPGHGIDEDESSDDDAAPAGGWKKPTGQQPSEKTNTWFGFIICKLHGVVDGPCQSFKIKSRGNGRGIPKTFFLVPGKESFEEHGTWYLPLPAHRKKGAWRLSCGCARPVLKNIIVTIVTEHVEELDDTEVDENTLLIDTLRRKWKSEPYKGETIPR
jgi:hypothetical protein